MNCKHLCLIVILLSLIIIASCSSGPAPLQDLDSSSRLQPSAEYQDTLVYHKLDVDGKKYTKFIIDPVEIYKGSNADFGSVSPVNQNTVADFIKNELKGFFRENMPLSSIHRARCSAPESDLCGIGTDKTGPCNGYPRNPNRACNEYG